MSNGLPEGKRIRIRSFYGFSPEKDGYVGWSKETDRDAYLRKFSDGDLLMIYGASTSETKPSERAYVLGFVEIGKTPIRDVEKASAAGMQRKRDRGWEGEWSFGIPVRRAWRAEDRMMIARIAFNSYDPKAGQAIAVHGAELDDDEIAMALKIKVREVNVFGEPPLAEDETPVQPFAKVFTPSRGVPSVKGEITSKHEDGDTYLYLAVYSGDGHAFLGRPKTIGDKSVALKIGVTKNLKARFKRLNSGIPPAARGQWKPHLTSQPYPDESSARAAETAFKDRAVSRLESLGNEFFWARVEDAEPLFWSLHGMARFSSK